MRSALPLIVGVLLIPVGCDKSGKGENPEGGDENTPLGEPVATIRPGDLFDAYQANPIGADQKYKGKVLLLKDSAARVIEKGGRYYLNLYGAQSLRTGNVAPAVIGRIERGAEGAFANFGPQDAVDVIGVCVGKRTDWPDTWKGYYVLVDRCTLRPRKGDR